MAPKHSSTYHHRFTRPPLPPLQDTTRPIQTRVPSTWAKPTDQLEITPEGGRQRDKKRDARIEDDRNGVVGNSTDGLSVGMSKVGLICNGIVVCI